MGIYIDTERGTAKKTTKVTYICRSKKNPVLTLFIYLFIFIVPFFLSRFRALRNKGSKKNAV
jgi:hypothetical protein